jgi:hypothetical protein
MGRSSKHLQRRRQDKLFGICYVFERDGPLSEKVKHFLKNVSVGSSRRNEPMGHCLWQHHLEE